MNISHHVSRYGSVDNSSLTGSLRAFLLSSLNSFSCPVFLLRSQ
ncbi:hypothetical protein BN131_2420 [Cronobacter malonaticus 681]|nr:hypothetical protein BN131_2420 [Cronobacter malonaticus 681]